MGKLLLLAHLTSPHEELLISLVRLHIDESTFTRGKITSSPAVPLMGLGECHLPLSQFSFSNSPAAGCWVATQNPGLQVELEFQIN